MPDARESIVDADGELGSTPVVPEKDAQSREGTAQGATADGGAANAMPDAVPVRYFNFRLRHPTAQKEAKGSLP